MDNIEKINEEIEDTIKNIKYDYIIGEIMETKISGIHHYITIKNENQYILKCTSWGKSYKNIKIGNIIKIEGSLKFMKKMFSIYYNIRTLIVIDEIGNELTTYDLLKTRLINEGFIGNVKRSLINYPYNIGLITAQNSAVIKDVLSIFQEDGFIGRAVMKHSTMQGDNAVQSIINAINYFNELSDIDIIIIFRGGGSKTDLEVFNNYEMLKAIHNSKIIIIGAIGHATDTDELINFVCDIPKETPSIASKYIIEQQKSYFNKIEQIKFKFGNIMNKYNEHIQKFKNINYNQKINYYNNSTLQHNIKLLKNIIDVNLLNYSYAKNNFMEQINKLNPVLLKNNIRINTFEDFITGSKKLKILFVDNKSVDIYYKIIENNNNN
jgi:exodeoxyribonuclease VII large subunit